MNYEKQNFENDQILDASQLNHIEDGITALDTNKADKSELFSKDYNDLNNKPDIPSIEGLATEEFVFENLPCYEIAGGVDLVFEHDGTVDGKDQAVDNGGYIPYTKIADFNPEDFDLYLSSLQNNGYTITYNNGEIITENLVYTFSSVIHSGNVLLIAKEAGTFAYYKVPSPGIYVRRYMDGTYITKLEITLGSGQGELKKLDEKFLPDSIQNKTDNNLATNDKTIVGAINELFQSANNGKELIASAIGEPLSAEDTFSAMSNDINGLLSTFKTNMMNNGITVENSDRFKQLIDKIATMAEEGSGKGIRYDTGAYSLGEITTFNEFFSDKWNEVNYQGIIIPKTSDLNFIYVYTDYQYSFYHSSTDKNYDVYITDCIVYDPLLQSLSDGSVYVFIHSLYFVYDTSTGEKVESSSWYTYTRLIDNTDHVLLPLIGSYCYGSVHALTYDNITYNTYYSVGVGEEDTTLRDSLASILQEEGVNVTEEDDMASLISKVDSEFTDKNNEVTAKENEITTLESSLESTKTKLYNRMLENNYSLEANLTLDELIDLLQISRIELPSIKQITGGSDHIFVLKEDGTLWAYGSNSYGQLGLGNTTSVSKFTKVPLDNVISIACGAWHSCAIVNKDLTATSGTLYVCGKNESGSIGQGSSTTNYTSFIAEASNVAQVACGTYFTMYLDADGLVYGTGFNANGELGLTNSTVNYFTNTYEGAKQIACGSNHSFVLATNGYLYASGANGSGQLGRGNTTSSTSYVRVRTGVAEVYAGDDHTIIKTTDGAIYGCGSDNEGQLGKDGNDYTSFTSINISNIVQIACGHNHTVLLDSNGVMYIAGDNQYGQVGASGNSYLYSWTTKTDLPELRYIACSKYATFAIDVDENLLGCGNISGLSSNTRVFNQITC